MADVTPDNASARPPAVDQEMVRALEVLSRHRDLILSKARTVPVERLGDGDDPSADRALVESLGGLDEKELVPVLRDVIAPLGIEAQREIVAAVYGLTVPDDDSIDVEIEIPARWLHFAARQLLRGR